jgi:tetratricopeptide (TPR) repeat protein
MIGKYVLGVVALVTLILGSTMTATAQVGELRGHVWMQQADGQKVPLADAQIDVFRVDVKGEYKTKTNKKGEFVFAGLPFVGDYIVAASHPTAAPNFQPKVKAGREIQCDITVTPGDGKRFTLDEIKSVNVTAAPATGGSGSGNSGGGESAADKAKREELMRKNAEIEANNRKITDANAIIARTFKAGNEALTAAGVALKAGNSELAIQKYTDALTQFDEGLAADPEQPAILTNKAVSLKARGVEKFNAAVRSKDENGKTAALEAAKADFKAAAEASTKAVTLLKAQSAPSDPAELQRLNSNKYAAFLTHAEAMRLFVSKADQSQADAGLEAYKNYLAVETDPVKKAKAQLDAAQMLLDAGQSDKAFAEFQTIVTSTPDNPEANLGAGLALFATGDKTKFQDAANYLQHFVDVAPDTHVMKADAKAILTELKNTEKVVPEKSTPAKRRRP